MRALFPGHYRPTPAEMKQLWDEAIFIFDTNVLLNLYSYPEEARNVFSSILTKIAERSWIPYQVAFEFHKNKFARMKQSNSDVQKLRNKLETARSQLERDFKSIEFDKRNTGIADIASRIKAVQDAYDRLLEAVELACARLPRVSLEDPIGNHVAEVFSGRVGIGPVDQAAMDVYIADGDSRYDKKFRPGLGILKKPKNIWTLKLDIQRNLVILYCGVNLSNILKKTT